MADKPASKGRILFLYKYLFEHTDGQHRIRLADLIEICKSGDYSANAHTLRDDIKILNDLGFSVASHQDGVTMYYWCDSHPLQNAEIRMLIDAVSSAHFIGKNESENLICKLLELASVHQEERLHDGVEVDYRVKTENPVIMQITDIINQAIYEKRQISFQYYDVLTETEQRLRNHGEPYVISPYLTHCDEDRYYVVGYREQKGIIQTFRLDRMALPIILEQAAAEPPADFCPEDYGKSVFKMYTGKKESVTLKCSEEVRKNVYDRFGEDIPVIQEEEGCFRTTVAVSVSKTFYTWISNYGGQILILEPLDVKQRYSEFLRRLLAYNEGVAAVLDK